MLIRPGHQEYGSCAKSNEEWVFQASTTMGTYMVQMVQDDAGSRGAGGQGGITISSLTPPLDNERFEEEL